MDEGHKILVFSQFVEMLSIIRKELEKEGYTYEYLDGQTPAKERLERWTVSMPRPIFQSSLSA
ncbi:MAG: SWF/SNF helicase family protein [Candidatus Competibacteraceae bacterium]|nr:SWF/SNF helicase family protein [Candidatus Competibacteraceae bacterium]